MSAPVVSTASGVATIDLAPGTPAAALPAEDIAETAARELANAGCLRLVHAFAPEFVAELGRIHDRRHARYFPERDYPDARSWGRNRTVLPLEVDGAFNAPAFYANPWVIGVARRVLGADCILGHLETVLTRPGSEEASAHRDAKSLFGDDRFDVIAPPNGIAMVVPFQPLEAHAGGARVWPGTQRVADLVEARQGPSFEVDLPLGSCLLFDLRLVHGGSANPTDRMRATAYFAYQRAWLRDWDGRDRQPPLSISRRALAQVPPEYLHLFEWRFDRYRSQRVRIAMRRLASRALPAIDWALRRSAG